MTVSVNTKACNNVSFWVVLCIIDNYVFIALFLYTFHNQKCYVRHLMEFLFKFVMWGPYTFMMYGTLLNCKYQHAFESILLNHSLFKIVKYFRKLNRDGLYWLVQ